MDFESLCMLEDLKKQILTDINIVGRENGVSNITL